jgi:hypothetical protein
MNGNLWLTALDAEKGNMEVPAYLVSDEGPFLVHRGSFPSAVSEQKGWGALLGSLS